MEDRIILQMDGRLGVGILFCCHEVKANNPQQLEEFAKEKISILFKKHKKELKKITKKK